jgi:Flp pilus assembly protein protease CpaA
MRAIAWRSWRCANSIATTSAHVGVKFVIAALSIRRRRRSAVVFIRHAVSMACLAHDEESLVFAVAIGVLLGPSRCLRSGELA